MIRWITEFRDGQISLPAGRLFYMGFIDYAVDAERILQRRLTAWEWRVLMDVHRHGYRPADAIARHCALLPDRLAVAVAALSPDTVLARIEAKLGKIAKAEHLIGRATT